MTPPSLWQTVLKLVGALIVILPLVYIVTRLYSRRMSASGQKRMLRVVDAIALGPNRSIFVVEVGGRLLVVGATQRQMTLLSEIKDEEFVQQFEKPVEPS